MRMRVRAMRGLLLSGIERVGGRLMFGLRWRTASEKQSGGNVHCTYAWTSMWEASARCNIDNEKPCNHSNIRHHF